LSSIGSDLPDWLTKLGISNEAPEGFVADNVIYSFYIGAAVLIISILYTIITTKEYSPEEFASFEGGKEIAEEKSKMSDIFKDFANGLTDEKIGNCSVFLMVCIIYHVGFYNECFGDASFRAFPEDTHSAEFNKAGDLTGSLFGSYNFYAIFFAFALTPIAKFIGKKQTHALALASGGFGLISMYFIKT
jgi:maltose/moltooligosaccharide transporter